MAVKAVGPLDARIAIVGEAPGRDEVARGEPFVGAAGRVLDAALRQVGITRPECYITNVSLERPANNNFGALYYYDQHTRRRPRPELLVEHTRLHTELAKVKTNLVVALGAEALYALIGKRDITERRGSVLWSDAIQRKVMGGIHPAAILHDPGSGFYPLLVFDLGRAKRECRTPSINHPKRTLVLRPSIQDVKHHLGRMTANLDPVTFDIECERDASKGLHCVAFSDAADWAMCVPMTKSWGGIDQDYIDAVYPLVQRFLENVLIPKVAQNAQFDVLYLRHHYGWNVEPIVFDTMTAHHTVYPELPKGLDTLASLYTDQPYYKDMERIPPDLWEYNALDACVTHECYKALDHELGDFNVREFYHEYVLPLTVPLMDMQEQGVCVDVPRRGEVAAALTEELDDHQAVLNHQAYGWAVVQRTPTVPGPNGKGIKKLPLGLSAQAPKQLMDHLYDVRKLPRVYKRKTGAVTTDEDALDRLAKKYPETEELRTILEIRGKQKLLSTYILAPLGPDHRMRCSYVVGGTETGRLASRSSIFGTGTNLQNVPKGVARRLLIPAPGLTFVQADLSQAEARVVAYLADDERLIDLFNRPPDPITKERFDVHRENAAHLFHAGNGGDVTPKEREVAKRLVHAANYGIGPNKFREVLAGFGVVVTQAEARRLLALYHARFPSITKWHLGVEANLRRTRVLATPVGRRRTFYGRWSEELLREAYAYVPQSTVADVLNQGLVELYPSLRHVDRTARLVLTVHDSVVVECRPTHTRPVARHLLRILERPLTINRRTCLIPADLKTGPNWDALKDLRV